MTASVRHPRFAEIERRVFIAAKALQRAVEFGDPLAMSRASEEFAAAREEQAACRRWVPA